MESYTLSDLMPVLSVVVPCYNEEESISITHQRLSEVLSGLDLPYEIVYVNDGSRDATLEIVRKIALGDPAVRLLSFARNFGHQTAVTAGIDHARGEAVILIDADLQDPPEIIPEMLAKWREGYQVVYGQRLTRSGETAFKKVTARAFYRLLNKLSEVPMPLDTGDFRLMDRAVVNVLRDMPERHRFIRGMVSWVGFRQTAVSYHRAERFAGESKYPLKKMIAFATDGLLSFSTKPLRVATTLGLVTSGISVLGILYALAMRIFTSQWVEGWTLLMISVLLLGSIQLICLGILGEYIGRIYNEAKRRPLYIVGYDSLNEPRNANHREGEGILG